MLTRRSLLFGMFVLAVSAQGCSQGPTISWGDKSIEIIGSDIGSLNLGADQVEITWPNLRIVIRETEITMNQETKKVEPFKRVVIHIKSDAATITVDGKTIFA